MSRISRDIYTSIDVNGPYIRIDTQPTSTTSEHNQNAVFTLAASIYYLTGDEAEIGDIDTLETDAVAPTDSSLDNQTPGIPHTAKNQGYISYQWYEINETSGDTIKLTNGTLYSGVTTNTLTVINTLSPTSHLNQYYCELDYIPTTVSGEFDTGNAVNDIVTSDIVTLNVRPFIIIDTQPISTTTFLNPDSGTTFTKASLSDTRFPWNDYRLEFQWWEKDKENISTVPNLRLIDGDYSERITTSKSTESVINEIQTTILTESIIAGQSKRVGIPTEAVDVTFTLSGAAGGTGGDEDSSSLGGTRGKGKTGEFKLSSNELFRINNATGPTEYILAGGTKGGDGKSGTSSNGGSRGYSFDTNISSGNVNDSTNGGRGGNSGPGGISGSGGGGGAASFIIKNDIDPKWLAIAAGGGGGGGGSKDASGLTGGNAGEWSEVSTNTFASEVKQATVTNYNPIGGTGSNPQDSVDYGFYIKSSAPISSPNTTDNYRVVVIWDGVVVVNELSTKLLSNGDGSLYVASGGINYFIQTYRDSQLGWCDDESNLSSVCIRGNGGYVNTFDVYKFASPVSGIVAFDGASGTDKTTGDGGGGGGGGGGAISPTTGGGVGKDPIPADNVNLTFKITQTASRSQMGSSYIEFVEVPWYGVNPDTEPSRGQVVRFNRDSGTTQTVSLKTNTTYDVYSSFEDGRTSDSLRILQDFTPDANAGDVIAGRSIGFNLNGDGDNIQTGNENDFRDFIVSVSDGTFDISPQTVKLDDGEIVGKAIIRFTTPAAVRNSVSATGGEGGASQYSSDELTLIQSNLNDGEGGVTMTVKTEQPFNTLIEDIISNSYTINYSIRGAHPYPPSDSTYKESGYTSNLTITADHALSKRILCQISAIDTSFATRTLAATSFSNTVYTNTVDFIVLDGNNNTITIEGIRHNDDFAVISSTNLDNGDLTLERVGSTSTKEIEYYSFYSNQDLEVDIKLFGGKGNDVNGHVGGEGGFSYVRLNMEANTEYVIAGLNEYVNTPYLFKGGRLLACVGGGGDANTLGSGAPGGGISIPGGSAFRGGIGGIAPNTLTSTGVLGSSSNNFPIAPDTKAAIPNGGTTIRCSKGNLFQFANQPDPCETRGSSVRFGLSDGTEVTNTKQISRGFKAGYNILKTGGRNNGAIANQGWGGSGATGGQGSDQYGGGGGSGFIIPDLTTDIFVRSEGQSNQDGTDPLTSTLGGSTGNAKVVISLAEVPSRFLPEFIERPAETNLIINEEDVIPESAFVPLPEIVPPPPVTPPNPRMSITSVVSKGWNSGDVTYSTFTGQTEINVLESGSLDVNIRTDDIPANTPFYWKIEKLTNNSQYTDDDFTAVTGSFRTSVSGGVTVGSFNINPREDNQTDFIGGDQDWRFYIYSDSNHVFRMVGFIGRFRTLDTSLAAPTATFTSLTADGPGGNLNARAKNFISEGEPPRQIDFSTTDIPNGSTVKWYIENVTSQNADFVATSGTEIVTSDFRLNNPDAYAQWNNGGSLSTANQGTGSFTIQAVEDSTTEGDQFFGLKIEYPPNSGNFIANSTTGTAKHIKILDTSQNPGATITGGASVEEGSTLTLTVDTNSIATNSVIYWKIFKSDDSAVDANEFESTTGSFTVNPTSLNASFVRLGQETFDITPNPDNLTEPTENFVVKLYRNEGRTLALNTPGTSNHSTHSFSVVNTSFSPTVYAMAFGENKNVVAGFTQYAETDEKITAKFRAWHLNPALAGSGLDKVHFAISYYYEEEFAVEGSLKRTNDRIPDFDINRGTVTLVFKGYVSSEGSTSSPVPNSNSEKFIPYWEGSQEIIPVEDYIDDGDKYFEIRLYTDISHRDKLNDAYKGSPLEFSVKDDSGPIYEFNTEYGHGVGSNPSGFLGPSILAPTNGNAPTIEEGDVYSFRIETTNKPGTALYYEITPAGFGGGFTSQDGDDFELPFSFNGRIPVAPTGYSEIRNSRYYTIDGDLETFAPTAEFIGDANYQGRGSYGDLRVGGLRMDRSIAFIYVKPREDLLTESAEKFNITVYDSTIFSTTSQVATVTCTITKSEAPAAPTVTLTCSPTSVNTGDSFTLEWKLTNVSNKNEIDNSTNPNELIAPVGGSQISRNWYNNNSSVSIQTSSPTTPGLSQTLEYKAIVFNKAGISAEDTATVTVTQPHTTGCTDPNALNYNSNATQDDGSCTYPTPVVRKRYRVYPLWRYIRRGANEKDRFAHNPDTSFTNFLSLPTRVPPGAPGSPTFEGNRTNYQVEGALGGVFLANDLPPGVVTSTIPIDNETSAPVTWYYFNTSVVGSKLMNVHIRDHGVEKYHLRNAGEQFTGTSGALNGWDPTNYNSTHKFYLMNGIYQDPDGSGIWYWDDTR